MVRGHEAHRPLAVVTTRSAEAWRFRVVGSPDAIAESPADRANTAPDRESQDRDFGEASCISGVHGPGINAAAGVEVAIMSACRSCIGPCFRQRQACTVRVPVQDKGSPAWPGVGRTACIGATYARSNKSLASKGVGCAERRRPQVREAHTRSPLRGVWKNNGSAVETEPHGETRAMGAEKTRDINRLARAALERERKVRAYRAEVVDHWRFQGVYAGK